MSNCIERNPVKSLVIYSITLILAVWTISTFILGDNKDKLHEKQIDNLNAVLLIKEEKIKHLERENYNLITDNHKYLEWLQSMPQSVLYFSGKIKQLEAEISEKETVTLIGNTPQIKAEEYFFESPTIREGQAFCDQKTGVIIGISNINVYKSAEAIINLPGQNEIVLNSVKAGNKWEFIYDEKKYELVLVEVNFVGSSFKVRLKELHGAIPNLSTSP